MSSTIVATNPSRRSFLATSGGLLIGFALSPRSLFAAQQTPGTALPAGFFDPMPEAQPNAYVRIGRDESVTLFIPKSEMGQGATTACAQLLAEELECDWSKVRMEIAPVNPEAYGHQTTVGSRAVRSTWEPLRKAGAGAREMLVQAAAQQWNVTPSQCRAENGFVINTTTNARLSYGSLADSAAKLPAPTNVTLKDPQQFRLIGKPLKRLDTREKVTGRAVFGIDARPEGLVYAVVARCPVFGGKLASVDANKAKAIPGVKDVVRVPSGVAVIADNTWAALQGRQALMIQWDEGPSASATTAGFRKMFADRARQPGAVALRVGEGEGGLVRAAKLVEAVYEVSFLAHASMEPLNCTVHARRDGAEVWASTQSPTTSRMIVAETLGLKPEQVTFHTLFCGGGFGRRGEGELEWVAEAAEVAKRVQGPVKVTWSREDDMQHDFYRPASYAELRGGVDAAGWPSAFCAKVACPTWGPMRDGVSGTAVSGLSNLPYDIPHVLVDYRVADTHVPVSYWRAPGVNQNLYFLESFLDELAAASGKDPLDVRRRLLAKEPRLLNVLNLAAEKAGWGKPIPRGRFQGAAVGMGVGSYNAQVAEVSFTNGKLRVHRVVCAFDCGQVVNPNTLSNQLAGGIIWGLSSVLNEITIDRGRVRQGNFNTYDVVRMDSAPTIDVHLVSSTAPPSGAGEAVNPTTVPAVVNAIFAATGKRVRVLPIRPADLA